MRKTQHFGDPTIYGNHHILATKCLFFGRYDGKYERYVHGITVFFCVLPFGVIKHGWELLAAPPVHGPIYMCFLSLASNMVFDGEKISGKLKLMDASEIRISSAITRLRDFQNMQKSWGVILLLSLGFVLQGDYHSDVTFSDDRKNVWFNGDPGPKWTHGVEKWIRSGLLGKSTTLW